MFARESWVCSVHRYRTARQTCRMELVHEVRDRRFPLAADVTSVPGTFTLLAVHTGSSFTETSLRTASDLLHTCSAFHRMVLNRLMHAWLARRAQDPTNTTSAGEFHTFKLTLWAPAFHYAYRAYGRRHAK
ncbi:uncharacterized protein F5891DRAFT_1172697 [Suillus fuscotomentosus]|uniref:Uncharacterized protein n=1 Tax=Suillus fuscotomentosus TaxID=1912939 RepID=A0AAD4E873_9AGAM|nr:uncharacterized protein F5891DRAFT_1172697 [Suillus fuscotomentosus]KAG1901464.1 hypothetical protein F5891DRAFT_1172697 [Suillus fuscotomentosus]